MEGFGTDGIRSTNTNALCRFGYRLGFAQKGKSKVVLGRDNRPDGEAIAAYVAQGLADAQVDVLYVGIVPTPVVQWATPFCAADAGIIVTASHNGPDYNGLKYVGENGEKADVDELQALWQAMSAAPDGTGRRLPPVNDSIVKAYCEAISVGAIDGLQIGVDCANGASYNVIRRVLGKSKANVMYVHHGDGKNINRLCGAVHPESLCEIVRREGLDMGFALDGDGDRCIAVTKQGRVIDGDDMLYLLTLFDSERYASAGVVGTSLTNGALGNVLRQAGIRLHRSEVGDGNVAALMKKTGSHLGAEPSGHVLLDSGYADGLRTGLALCALAARYDLDSALAGYQPYPQCHTTCPQSVGALVLVKKLGEKYNKSSAQVILRWHTRMGFVVIPGSKNVAHIRDNLDILDFTLTEEEMAEIAKLNKGKRYYIRTDAALAGFAGWQPTYEKTNHFAENSRSTDY